MVRGFFNLKKETMKNIFISGLILSASILSFSQNFKKNPNLDVKSTRSRNVLVSNSLFPPGDTFWYEDFANGISGNAVDGFGNLIGGSINWVKGDNGSGYSNVWQHDFDGPNGQYESAGPLLSESSSNGFMIFDANQQTDNLNPGGFITIDGFLESPAIDVSSMGTSSLGVELQHTYRTCCSNSSYPVIVYVGYFDNSITNWAWTQKKISNETHNTYPAAVTLTGYEVEKKLFSIADVVSLAQNNTNEIKIRFHWNPDLNTSNSYYMWMIDDMRIKELYYNDSRLLSIYSGDIINDFEYYHIPDAQITNYILTVGGDIENIGGNNLTNAHIDVKITDPSNNLVYSDKSNFQNLIIGGEIQVWKNTGYAFTPGNYGVYNINITSSHDESDDHDSDNTLTKKIEYTEYEMGHYNPNGVLTTDVVNSGSNPGRVLQYYGIYSDAFIYGINIYLLDGATTQNTIGQIAYVGIYDGSDAFTELAYQEFEVTASMIGKVTTILFDTPYYTFTGDYFYAALGSFGGGDNLIVAREFNGDLDNSSLIDINGTLYADSGDDYVNLWFRNCLTSETPSISASQYTLNCAGTVDINVVGGSLNENETWVLYSNYCGGTYIGSSPLGNFSTVAINNTEEFYIRGENGCTPGPCEKIIITLNDEYPEVDEITLPDVVEDCEVSFLEVPTATDFCDGQILGVTSTTLPINSSSTIYWSYTDSFGNTTWQSQNIIISVNINNTISQLGNKLSSEETDPSALYQWIDCEVGTEIIGESNKDFLPTKSGSYKVSVSKSGCVLESDCYNFTYVGIDNESISFIDVYPNPFSLSIYVNIKDISENSSAQINDIMGRVLINEKLNSNKTEINLEKLEPGIYFLVLKTMNNQYQIKIEKV